MSAFTLTQKAKLDLKSIAAYTQQKWGAKQRRFYLKQFDDALYLLKLQIRESNVISSKQDIENFHAQAISFFIEAEPIAKLK